MKELDVSDANNFATIVAVLNALEQVGHSGADQASRQLARSAATELRNIVPAVVLDAPRLAKVHETFTDETSFCQLVAAEFPLKEHHLPDRYQSTNQHGWTIEEVCESVPGTERSERNEWISSATGEVLCITYHFADSSALHVYPTFGHWVPS